MHGVVNSKLSMVEESKELVLHSLELLDQELKKIRTKVACDIAVSIDGGKYFNDRKL